MRYEHLNNYDRKKSGRLRGDIYLVGGVLVQGLRVQESSLRQDLELRHLRVYKQGFALTHCRPLAAMLSPAPFGDYSNYN